MDQSEWEARAIRDGFDVRAVELAPHTHRPAHTHPFDARLFILRGALTLLRGKARDRFAAGDSCDVPAGVTHEEHSEGEGARYLAGRRASPAAS